MGKSVSVRTMLDRLGRADLVAVRNGETPVATGFEPLDRELEGGFRAGELAVLGGPPGVGKTAVALQWARHAAAAGRDVAFVCYEHDPDQLFGRLLAAEIGALGAVGDADERAQLRDVIRDAMAGAWGAQGPASRLPRVRAALSRIDVYAHHLQLIGGSRLTTLVELEQLCVEFGAANGLIIVDYLQKLPIPELAGDSNGRMVAAAEGLKDIALRQHVAVVALSSAGSQALRERRLGLPSLRGAAAIAYEADIAIVMNEKREIVSRVHVNSDPARLRSFAGWVVMTIEKNRRGPAPIDTEFAKNLEFFRLEPAGRYVSEKLIDEILYLE